MKRNLINFSFAVLKHKLKHYGEFEKQGVYFISGYPGSGKTMLASHIINSVDASKYYFLTNIDEFYQSNVYSFDLDSVIGNGTIIGKLPIKIENKRLYGVIIDEVNLKFNRRNNRRSSYNDMFIGLIELCTSYRHLGIPRIYFIGQFEQLQDIQLQVCFKYFYNIVRSRKIASYSIYKEKGIISYIPSKIRLQAKRRGLNGEFSNYSKKIKFKKEDYLNYNHLGLKDKYNNVGYAPIYERK